jgi:hypothetical protein
VPKGVVQVWEDKAGHRYMSPIRVQGVSCAKCWKSPTSEGLMKLVEEA